THYVPDRGPCKRPSPPPGNDEPSAAYRSLLIRRSHPARQNLRPTQNAFPSPLLHGPPARVLQHRRSACVETAALLPPASHGHVPIYSTLRREFPARVPRYMKAFALTMTSRRPGVRKPS